MSVVNTFKSVPGRQSRHGRSRARTMLAAAVIAVAPLTAGVAPGGAAVDSRAHQTHRRAAYNGRILFQATVGGHTQVFTIAADGTRRRQVTRQPDAEQGDWSPDGSMIAFDAPTTQAVSVFTVRADSTGTAEVPLDVGGFNGAPTYSPNGAMIAFDHDGGPSQPTDHGIFVANADGSGAHRVTTGIASNDAFDTNADWSPDSRRLVFTRVKNSKQAAIFVVNVDGSALRRLTPWKLDAAYGSWSPAGPTIVFESYFDPHPGKSANLFTIPAAGGHMTALTHFHGGATHAYGPAWSPDGTKIVWHRVGPRTNQLFVMDNHGAHVRQLTHMPHDSNPGHADWGAGH